MKVKTKLPIALAAVFIAALVYIGSTWAAFKAETEASVVNVTGGTYNMEATLMEKQDSTGTAYGGFTVSTETPTIKKADPIDFTSALGEADEDGKRHAQIYFKLENKGQTGLTYQMGTNQTSTRMRFTLLDQDGKPTGEPSPTLSGYLKTGETRLYEVDYTTKAYGTSAEVKFDNIYTAAGNTTIQTAGNFESLNNQTFAPGTVVYLTGDIAAPDKNLTFNGAMPTINLNGHTLNVKSMTVNNTPTDYDGQAIISNGKLTVGGTNYTEGTLPVRPSAGKVTITLKDLTADPVAPTEPTIPPEAPAAPETGDPVTEPDVPAEEPVTTPEPSAPQTPAEPQAPDTPSDDGTADTTQPPAETEPAEPAV